MITVYKCELCSKEFDSQEQCKNHEEKHKTIRTLQVDSAYYEKEDDVNSFPRSIWVIDIKDGSAVAYHRDKGITSGPSH